MFSKLAALTYVDAEKSYWFRKIVYPIKISHYFFKNYIKR